MAGFGMKSVKVTAPTSNTAVPLGIGYVPSTMLIHADPNNAGSVYIGGPDVTVSNGILLSTSAQKLGTIVSSGHTEDFRLENIYIVGTQNNDAVRIGHNMRYP